MWGAECTLHWVLLTQGPHEAADSHISDPGEQRLNVAGELA